MPNYRHARIADLVQELIDQYGTRDPFTIAQGEGLEIVYRSFEDLLGFYTRLNDQGFIVINQELGTNARRLICAHELGHDKLHRELAEDRLVQEHLFLDLRAQPEYEANLFAAALLLDTDEVLEGLMAGETLQSLSASLNIEPQLLHLKLRLMDLPQDRLPDYNDRFLQEMSVFDGLRHLTHEC